MNIFFSGHDGVRRRLTFNGLNPYSYTLDNLVKSPLHLKVPCGIIQEDQWLNLQFDLKSFVMYGYDNFRLDMKHIDSISLSGCMYLKRILLTNFQVPDSFPFLIAQKFGQKTANEFELNCSKIKLNNMKHEYYIEELPQSFNYPASINYVN